MKRIFLIGGAMGVGKTTTGQALKKRLPNSVFLDGDWCWDAHPFQVTDETKAMVMDNICHLLNNFIHCSAYENIIFCWVMHEQQIIEEMIGKLDAADCEVLPISLICDEAELRARIARDVARGLRVPEDAERSAARLPVYAALDTLKIDTTEMSADAVAEAICCLRG